jgi:hypothetical protein
LAALYDAARLEQRRGLRVGTLAIGLACLVTGWATTVRHLAIGDLNVVTWEWAARIGLQRPVRATAPDSSMGRIFGDLGQMQMTRYLRELGPRTTIAMLDSALEFSFLTGRRLLPLRVHAARRTERPPPELLLATPRLGLTKFLRPEAVLWLREQCDVEARFGDHVLYRVRGPWPDDIGILFPIGAREASNALRDPDAGTLPGRRRGGAGNAPR